MSVVNTFPKQALTDLGFACATSGLVEECRDISNGIAALYQHSPLPYLLNAICQLNINQPLMALTLLQEKALPLDPENPTIKVLIGFAYLRSGQNEKADTLLRPLSDASHNNDQASQALALECLAL